MQLDFNHFQRWNNGACPLGNILRFYLIAWSFNYIRWVPPKVYSKAMSNAAVNHRLGYVLRGIKLSSILFQTTQSFLMCLGYICYALMYFYLQLGYFGNRWVHFLLTYLAFFRWSVREPEWAKQRFWFSWLSIVV